MTTTAPSIATVCPFCGHNGADPQTGRCLECGKRVISPDLAAEFGHPTLDRALGQPRPSPSAAYRSNGSAPAEPVSPPATEPVAAAEEEAAAASVELRDCLDKQPSLSFVLPDSRETTSWLTKTRAVRDQLLTRADKALAQAKELTTEAERCRQTAAAFTSLLGQLSVAGAATDPPTETPPPVGGSPAPGADGQVVAGVRQVHRLREVRRAALR